MIAPVMAPSPNTVFPGVWYAREAVPINTVVSSQACGLSHENASAVDTACLRVMVVAPGPGMLSVMGTLADDSFGDPTFNEPLRAFNPIRKFLAALPP